MDIRKYLSRAVAEPTVLCTVRSVRTSANQEAQGLRVRRGHPSFGPKGGQPKDARQCRCKPSDAVDVKNKRCECGAGQPSFGPKGGQPKDARWCAKCKPSTPWMVHKRCECGLVRPTFGPKGGKPKDARWCAKCPKKPAEAVDVNHKRLRVRRGPAGLRTERWAA